MARLSRRNFLLAGLASGAAAVGTAALRGVSEQSPGLAAVQRSATAAHTPAAATSTDPLAVLDDLKLVSWYPFQAGWDRLWTDASLQEIDTDFAAISALGANAVRVIVSTYAFGYPQPRPGMVDKLHRILDDADRHGLQVQLTLFDFFGDYGDIEGSLAWMRMVLAGLSGDRRLCFVELRNEVDPTDEHALEWVAALSPTAKKALGSTLLTASVTSSAGMPAMAKWVSFIEGVVGMDFVDFHWYGQVDNAQSDLAWMQMVAGERKLFIGETGTSSRPAGATSSHQSEADQAAYMDAAFTACRELGLPVPAPWVWRDFTPQALPDVADDPSGLYFGLLRLDGSPKPAYDVVRRAFSPVRGALRH